MLTKRIEKTAVLNLLVMTLLLAMPLLILSSSKLFADNNSNIFVSVLSIFIYVTMALSVTIGCCRVRHSSEQNLMVWVFFAIAGCFLAASSLILIFKLNAPVLFSFFNSLDALYLLFYLFMMIGMILPQIQKNDPLLMLKKGLDLSVVLITLLMVFWICLIKPLLNSRPELANNLSFLIVIYPFLDILLLFLISALLLHLPVGLYSLAFWCFLLAFSVMCAADFTYVFLVINGSVKLMPWVQMGWYYSAVFIAFAGAASLITAKIQLKKVPVQTVDSFPGKGIASIITYIPYLMVILAYLLFVFYHNSSLNVEKELTIGMGLIFGMVIVRQLLVLQENRRLVYSLQSVLKQLRRQTTDLNRTNQDLQKEIEHRSVVQEKLSYDAMHDPLTGLSNRMLLTNRLEHAFDKVKRNPDLDYSVLFLDMDNFKSINDILGHIAGDLALIELSHRLLKCVRAVDTLARFGGDEFVILLENCGGKNVTLSVANRILAELQKPFLHQESRVKITCSIGIVQSIHGYLDPDDVLRDVDIAMYTAKKSGKAHFEVFNIEMGTAATYQLEVEGELHRAIINKELFLHFQPVIELKTGSILGFEALLRWQHPQRGLLEPDDFIPIAEESNAINPIGDWVIKAACRQLVEWHKNYPASKGLFISVNLSGKQILKNSLIPFLKKLFSETGLDPHLFRMEITENTLIVDQELVTRKIRELRNLGVPLSVDDFGTGYSSLYNLQSFQLDEIKIDQVFTEGIRTGHASLTICRGVIQMAKQLGITTVIEGIESQEQLAVFRSLDCDRGQGYYLARPMTAANIEETYLDRSKLEINLNTLE